MSEEDKDNKQFDPTDQKLRKAREKGDIPRSTEVNAALLYLGFFVVLLLSGAWMVPDWITMAHRLIGETTDYATARQLWGMSAIFAVIVAAIPAGFILIGLMAQRSIIFSGQKLAPDISRINPIKNAGQKFGKTGLVTFAISVSKACCVAIGGWFLCAALFGDLVDAAAGRERQWTQGLAHIAKQSVFLAIAISSLFAIIDLGAKHYDHRIRNRMTRKEIQDEFKDSEGDPHMKMARRQKAFDIVMNNMISDVEKADVIIVNPTHFAVALEWKRGSDRAPVCLAKGVDDIAARIRDKAKDHKVPIWSDPPCARALYATTEIGDEIDHDNFAAVAVAIRFAETMREKVRKGW